MGGRSGAQEVIPKAFTRQMASRPVDVYAGISLFLILFCVLFLSLQVKLTFESESPELTELRPHLRITGFKTIRFFSPGLGRGDGGYWSTFLHHIVALPILKNSRVLLPRKILVGTQQCRP